MKNNLFISFSGGRTSAYMTYRLLNDWRDQFNDVVVLFANTGQEREETLQFVHDCDTHFGFNTVWVEAVVNPEKGKGTTHKIVNFESASRTGEPFAESIETYGIPNASYPNCTRELKMAPMYSHMRSIGWKKGDYVVAIGIREDEQRRAGSDENIIYPFIDIEPVDKQDVNSWWEDQAFNLQLEEHQGNCKWCWKKSLKKHMKLISEDRSMFDFPMAMEKKYKTVKSPHGDRVFFRGNRSTQDLLNIHAELEFEKSISIHDQAGFDFDANGGCSEICEVFATK